MGLGIKKHSLRFCTKECRCCGIWIFYWTEGLVTSHHDDVVVINDIEILQLQYFIYMKCMHWRRREFSMRGRMG